MKRIKPIALCAALVSAALTGCAADNSHRNAGIGAAVGAIAGGVIGHQVHDENGRYVGAAIGALSGAAVGNYMDRQKRELEQNLREELRDREISIVRHDAETLRLDVASEASFAVNHADISPDFRHSLNTLANVLGKYDKTVVHIVGHTDSTGTRSYNQDLSERRAESVYRLFQSNGLADQRLRHTGRGEDIPVATNDSSAGRSRNRRVEIFLKPIVEGRQSQAYVSPR